MQKIAFCLSKTIETMRHCSFAIEDKTNAKVGFKGFKVTLERDQMVNF